MPSTIHLGWFHLSKMHIYFPRHIVSQPLLFRLTPELQITRKGVCQNNTVAIFPNDTIHTAFTRHESYKPRKFWFSLPHELAEIKSPPVRSKFECQIQTPGGIINFFLWEGGGGAYSEQKVVKWTPNYLRHVCFAPSINIRTVSQIFMIHTARL